MGNACPRIALACLLFVAGTARAQSADLEALRHDIDDAKARLQAEQRHLDDLEARLGALAPASTQAPAPGQPAASTAPVPAAAQPAQATPSASDASLEAQFAAALAASPKAAAPPAASPPPSSSGGGQLRLMDVSLDGLFAAGASTVNDDQIPLLDAGGHDPKERGFTVQNVELSFAGAVDPYVKGEAHIVYQLDQQGETGVELEEAFLTTQTLKHGLQLKAGQFFTEFGRLNPQHPHTWHFVNQPVVNSRLLGGDGLRGPGARLSWLTPVRKWYSEVFLTVQKPRGETATSFFGTPDQEPIGGHPNQGGKIASMNDLLVSARWLNSISLSDETTLNLGASGAFGPNGTGPDERTRILGADMYLKWKRTQNEKGWPFVAWQTEAMQRTYEAGAFTDTAGTLVPSETLHDWGVYSELTWGFKPGWTAGWRVDHADGDDSLALDQRLDPSRDRRTRLSAALTYYPTEFSKVRFQYDFDRAQFLGDTAADSGDAHSFWIQWEFTMGAHGAHSF